MSAISDRDLKKLVAGVVLAGGLGSPGVMGLGAGIANADPPCNWPTGYIPVAGQQCPPALRGSSVPSEGAPPNGNGPAFIPREGNVPLQPAGPETGVTPSPSTTSAPATTNATPPPDTPSTSRNLPNISPCGPDGVVLGRDPVTGKPICG
jgi:hypothetical protein